MTAAEEVKLNNFKAQLNSILAEIDTHNRVLETVQKDRETAEGDLAGILANIASATEQLGAIMVSIAKGNETIKQQDEHVASEDARLKKDREDFEEEKRLANEQIEKDRNRADQYVADKKKERDELERALPAKRKELSAVLDELAHWQGLAEGAEEKHNKFLDSAKAEKDELTSELRDIRRLRDSEDAALAEAHQKVEEEVEKIRLPQEALARDFRKMEHVRRNLSVYSKRVEKAHKAMFPDRPFII